MLSLGGLTVPGSDPTITVGSTSVKAAHIQELRTRLDAARSMLGLPALMDSGWLVPGSTYIAAAHVNDLRDGVK